LHRAIKGLNFQQKISQGKPDGRPNLREGAMIYLLFTSVAIYLLLVAACNASQRKDVCFTGFRAFIGALALVALVDLVPELSTYISAASTVPDTSSNKEANLSDTESGLPVSSPKEHVKIPAIIENDSSEYRLKSRAEKFLAQGRRASILSRPAAHRVKQLHGEDHTRIAARTALLGILLRRVGK